MSTYRTNNWGYLVLTAVLSVGLLAMGCGDKENGLENGTDTGDTSTDSPPPDCTGCVESGADICIGLVTGRLVTEDGQPRAGAVQMCPFRAEYPSTAYALCVVVETDANGAFEYKMVSGGECRGYAEADEAIVDVRLDTPDFVKFPSLFDPSPAEIDDDFSLDVGDLVLYAEPTDGTAYDDATGAVVDFGDGTLTIAAGQADSRDFPDGTVVSVREFALDGTEPLPFVPDDVALDGLYYVTPYFAQNFEHAIAVALDAAAVGWSDTDTGKLYQLGDLGETGLYCANSGATAVEQGHFFDCENLEVDTDAASTINFNINTPSWFGVAKN